MTMFKAAILTVCVLVAGVVFAAPSVRATDLAVTVSETALVDGPHVELGEIARIQVPDPELERTLDELFVAHAPNPSRDKSLRGAWIRARIERVEGLEEADIFVPRRVRVKCRYQQVDEDRLLAAFSRKMEAALGSGKQEPVQVTRFQTMGNGPVPEGDLELVINDPPAGRRLGQVSVKADILVDGRRERRVTLSGRVDMERPVVVAARSVDRHQVLTADDLTRKPHSLARLSGEPITDPDAARGMRTRISLSPGTVIQARDLEKPPVVFSGDEVTIEAQRGRLRVTSKGVARQTGALGEEIPVRPASGNKTITARVVRPGLVRVHF